MHRYLRIFAILGPVLSAQSIEIEDWQPVLTSSSLDGIKSLPAAHPQSGYRNVINHGYTHQQLSVGPQQQQEGNDQCQVYRIGFTQDLYFQYIQYKTHIPELKEFTLCFWSKFYNHSNDHPIFSYAVEGQPKAISSWVSNTERSSYFSLAVQGHTFFRLNYPLRLNKWYHTCESWNGKTGEWQIWVNAERVGRGFHNRLVGTVIKSGGVAITGQEQTQVGGGFLEGKDAPEGSGGMLGEITMVQLYKVALTAGKAHKDHKHHHAHQYDHNGNEIRTPPPPTPNSRPTLPSHPLLTGGQINPALRLNFAGGQPQNPSQNQLQIVPGQSFNAQLINGQFVSNAVTQQLTQGRSQPPRLIPVQAQLPFLLGNQLSGPVKLGIPPATAGSPIFGQYLAGPQNIQFLDTQLDTHQIFRRQNQEGTSGETNQEETSDETENNNNRQSRQTKAEEDNDSETDDENEDDAGIKESQHKKRELYLSGGTIIESLPTSGVNFDQSLLYGLAGIGDNQPILQQQKQDDEREPAEAEVKAVMNVCTGCDQEPFEKALVFGWRDVPKKLYSGAFYAPAVPQCNRF